MSDAVNVSLRSTQHNPEITVTATVNARHTQKVTITSDDGAVNLVWTGSGEGVTIGEAVITGQSNVNVLVENSTDGGSTFKPSEVKFYEIQTRSLPPLVIKTISAEDGGDRDYDDAVIHFRYVG